ncbi:uncharacterized protein LOC105664541 [Ceratitis capitata]|uniref:uncharacterized protein LOC105664541 n=1 Tax=Ceratitis capitata TaxID=7213 RepID=UPI0006188228|nr:uncharacterized protein LOC105664541 [Ceratitis capitata]
MGIVVTFVSIVVFLPIIYIGFVIYKKGINIRDVKINTANDLKRLLTPPLANRPLKYLQKAA